MTFVVAFLSGLGAGQLALLASGSAHAGAFVATTVAALLLRQFTTN